MRDLIFILCQFLFVPSRARERARTEAVEDSEKSFLNILLKTSCAIVTDESLCRCSLRATREKVAIHESDLNVAF
jgi:hypothetical protein